jgi:hypothetical protein
MARPPSCRRSGGHREEPGSKEIRVIYDGTHGVLSSHEIRVRNQLAFPMSSDMEAILHQMSSFALVWFALVTTSPLLIASFLSVSGIGATKLVDFKGTSTAGGNT